MLALWTRVSTPGLSSSGSGDPRGGVLRLGGGWECRVLRLHGSAVGDPTGHFCHLLLVKQIPRPVSGGRGCTRLPGRSAGCSLLPPALGVLRPCCPPQAKGLSLCGLWRGPAPGGVALSVVPAVDWLLSSRSPARRWGTLELRVCPRAGLTRCRPPRPGTLPSRLHPLLLSCIFNSAIWRAAKTSREEEAVVGSGLEELIGCGVCDNCGDGSTPCSPA